MNDTERPVFMAEHVAQINEAHCNMTVDLFALCDACADANADLHKDGKRELIKQLPFSGTKFSKYAQIGADPRLNIRSGATVLPPRYSIIYEVRQLSDEKLDTMEREGKLTPALRTGRRPSLAKWQFE